MVYKPVLDVPRRGTTSRVALLHRHGVIVGPATRLAQLLVVFRDLHLPVQAMGCCASTEDAVEAADIQVSVEEQGGQERTAISLP